MVTKLSQPQIPKFTSSQSSLEIQFHLKKKKNIAAGRRGKESREKGGDHPPFTPLRLTRCGAGQVASSSYKGQDGEGRLLWVRA